MSNLNLSKININNLETKQRYILKHKFKYTPVTNYSFGFKKNIPIKTNTNCIITDSSINLNNSVNSSHITDINNKFNNSFIEYDNLIFKSKFKHNIFPYFIYIPQFFHHYEKEFKFLDNYLETDNDLTMEKKKISVLQKQINLLNNYNFSGFGIYFYWFSKNNYSKSNLLFDYEISLFFNNRINFYDKKVFFIWDNSDWIFDDNTIDDIKNVYDFENFNTLSNILSNYFMHENYLKIDNKPVFFIKNYELINQGKDVDILKSILNEICVHNGFDGIHIILNYIPEMNHLYKQFNLDCNIEKMINDNNINKNSVFLNNVIQTVNYNLKKKKIKKNDLSYSKNVNSNKIILTNYLINSYDFIKTSEIDNILLVNILNEIDHTIKKTKKDDFYNLNLFFSLLCEE
jgi:hypothetical protein